MNRNLKNLLDAMDILKQDYTCCFCADLCKDPVILSACFHMICSSHFDRLSHCPTCNISLANSTLYRYDKLPNCVDAARNLSNMFEKLRQNATQNLGNETSAGSSKRRAKSKSETLETDPKLSTKENKPGKANLTRETSLQSNVNLNKNEILNNTILSSASSKFNKGNEKKNKKGETPLQVACRMGKFDVVSTLLKEGANTNTKDNAGWTPLHEVVQNGRLDLVQLLLQYNTLIDVPGLNNETPLHEAIRYSHQDIAVELVKNGANINARNCKGETPMQLASKEMKEILKQAEEDIVQTQSLNITIISDLVSELITDNMRVYCVSTARVVHTKLKLLVKQHLNMHIETKFTKKVTHLIVDTNEDDVCMSSLDVLQGIVNSMWIVSTKWIMNSTEEELEPFRNFEVLGVGTKIYNGPKNSRYNKYKQLPGIFNGCHFYLHNFNMEYEISKSIVLTKAVLTNLIYDAGGVILRRVPNPESIPEPERLVPYHAKEGSKLFNCSHYIIFKDMYEPMYNMTHIKALPIGWLIECIEKYELCDSW